jgi:hypothetical protein
LERLKVDLTLGVDVDREFVGQGDFDHVVLATGSTPAPEPFLSDGSVPLLDTGGAMSLVRRTDIGSVLVHDLLGTDEAAVVLEQLAAAGKRIYATTPLPTTGAFLGWTHLADHVQRLVERGVRIAERTDVVEIRDGQVTLRAQLDGTETRRVVDAVVLAQPRLAETALRADLLDMTGIEIHVVGDAEAPRSALHAFLSAENLARILDVPVPG